MLETKGGEVDPAKQQGNSCWLPTIVTRAGEKAGRRFVEFFTANIRNANTRRAYARAVGKFFTWCEDRGLELREVEPVTVAAYVEQHPGSKPSVKQCLSAIRMLFDWLVTGQIMPFNPAASVRGPRYAIRRGLTPVLTAGEARRLLDSIETTTIIGLRDRALIAVMAFSFARIGAVLGMRMEDYFVEAGEVWFRLHEKGGKLHCVPAHPMAAVYMDAYLAAAGMGDDWKGPLFRTVGRDHVLTPRAMASNDSLKMIKRRARAAALPRTTCNHTFRATGITMYLNNGGRLERAQELAAHEDIKTTKLYDRRREKSMMKEVRRISI
ncbi:tyrosine-type recombinase/integrase [Singulisphaera sp. PoT]|uniref:tyrosine-type recombinase/integrase n=1 Tax=Singulisphaera sp. PoT TaxID=3411797 RepID=UPI003BF5FD38